jgi:uncharacterized protein with NAD-binding domain and iron-sulfur cluster
MAGLTAAWELSRPEHRATIAEVTVHQRGWRLGGKGASSRGAHGRIEEHGLHVWLGYYDNAFALVREVYAELDRPATDPRCPVATWRDAFVPSDRVGVAEQGPHGWGAWVATFARDGREPGTVGPEGAGAPVLTAARFAERAIGLLGDLWTSLAPAGAAGGAAPRTGGRVVLSASPHPPAPTRPGPADAFAGTGDLLRRAGTAALVAALRAADELERSGLVPAPLRDLVLDRVGGLREALRGRVLDDEAGRRLWALADLLLACVRGMVVDGLTTVDRLPAIDDEDFRAWLARHGAEPATLSSPLVNGLYDLVFAYEDGDPERPAFAAGLGLFLAWKLFLEYKGALFWKMTAGMGDVVIAPLYEALRARGVRFRFFSQVEALRLADDGGLAAVELSRQAVVAAGPDAYDPLVRVRDLPCFPAGPDAAQLAGDGPPPAGTERHGAARPGDTPETLVVGRDVDVVVLATSLGVVPLVAADLLAASDRWRDMVSGVATVATQAAQLWLTRTEDELGWPHDGATLSGWAKPFDTYASMGHLLAREDWPAGDTPRGLVYLCSSLRAGEAADDGAVRARVAGVLARRMGDLWPAAAGLGGGVPADVLHGGLDAQFVTATDDPSDRYVQSLPGTDRYRLRADESGVDGLVLAGDWTNCGLNAGCIEAAVLSGRQAANAVLGRPLLAGVRGSWYPLTWAGAAAGVPA